MIIHLLAVKLDCPDTTEILFSKLFEICAFDFIPTDNIYQSIFGFDNEPLSDTLDIVGYGS